VACEDAVLEDGAGVERNRLCRCRGSKRRRSGGRRAEGDGRGQRGITGISGMKAWGACRRDVDGAIVVDVGLVGALGRAWDWRVEEENALAHALD